MANIPEKLSEAMHWLGQHGHWSCSRLYMKPTSYTELKMSLAFHLVTTSELKY